MKLKNITIVFIFLASNLINGMIGSQTLQQKQLLKDLYNLCLTSACSALKDQLFRKTNYSFNNCPPNDLKCLSLQGQLSDCMTVCTSENVQKCLITVVKDHCDRSKQWFNEHMCSRLKQNCIILHGTK